jgi:preprotein translocase subunit SecD
MLSFSRWSIGLIIIICFSSLLVALPNFLNEKQQSSLPSWFFQKKINLGLDLQGGSQLLLKVDFDSFQNDQMEILQDALRTVLRSNKVGYTDFKVINKKLYFSLRSSQDSSKLNNIIKKFNSELDLIHEKNDRFYLTYNEQTLKNMQDNVISQSIEIIRRRVDETGTKEPSIQKQGENFILLQVPGLNNPEHLKNLLGKTAKLSFHLIDENANIQEALKGHVTPGTILLPMDKSEHNDKFLVVKKKIILSGDQLIKASASFASQDQNSGLNNASVSISFNNIGAKLFGNITKENVGRYLAIVLDNKIISAARINEPILGGQCQISGSFTVKEANDLALLLRAGSLLAPLSIIEERTVGPNLGQDSINAGKKASIASIILIMVFMLLTYSVAGIFANIALLVNIILIISSLSVLQATLTMPGIAGIILTMGMAVDANVLIFERIREELKLGMSTLAATDRGFKKAYTTILDSNITTILVAILLYCFGSGVVKGFAVTLIIGILSSMFSAITLTRLMMYSWLKSSKKALIL